MVKVNAALDRLPEFTADPGFDPVVHGSAIFILDDVAYIERAWADAHDGRALLWYSGGNFEDTHRPRHLDEARARRELAVGLLRGIDRLDGRFAAAPVDDQLTDAQRALWEVSAEGRA